MRFFLVRMKWNAIRIRLKSGSCLVVFSRMVRWPHLCCYSDYASQTCSCTRSTRTLRATCSLQAQVLELSQQKFTFGEPLEGYFADVWIEPEGRDRPFGRENRLFMVH